MVKFLQLELSDSGKDSIEAQIYAKSLDQKSKVQVPITSRCSSYGDLEIAAANFKKELDILILQAKKEFEKVDQKKVEFNSEGSVENIWNSLSKIEEKEGLFDRFNTLDSDTRGKIANYVFATQNAFKGAALIFSTHYNEEENILE